MSDVDMHAVRFVDRTGWGPGEWDEEDDRYEWRTGTGLMGLIVRGPAGALCGYVGVTPDHPAHGRSWRSADCYERGADGALDYARPKPNPTNDLRVHGGITYAEACAGRVCHVPAPGEPEHLWWLGFDCSHAWDLAPTAAAFWARRGHPSEGVYRGLTYVRNQVESLAEQLAALAVPAEATP